MILGSPGGLHATGWSLEMEEGGRRIRRGTFAQKELQGHFKAQEGLTPALLAGRAEGGGCEQGLQMAPGSGDQR